MTDQYWAWWADKLAGVDLQASEGEPYAGFYRWIRKTGYGSKKYAIPVAYWPGENGELHCRVGFNNVSDEHGRDIWIHVFDNPVPEDWYRDVTEKRPPDLEWRDGLSTVPPMGDNLPPSDMNIEWLTEQISGRAEEAKIYLDGPPITEQIQADVIGNLGDRLAELHKLAEEARKTERKPHDDALREIQQKWTPLLLMAEIYKNLKYALITPWQLAQQKAQKEQAEAAVAAGEPEAALEQTRRPRAGTRGRAMTLRTFKRAEITDYALCLDHFKEHENVREAVQDLANKAIRVGITVPGAKLVEEQRTV